MPYIQFKKSFPFVSVKATRQGNTVIQRGSEYFYELLTSGSSSLLNTTTLEGQAYAYNYSHAVNTVINRKVRAHINGLWRLEDEDRNEVTGALPNIERLMIKPNPVQSWTDFNSQMKILTQVFGECYIMPLVPAGFFRKDTEALWIIPNWMITAKKTGKFIQQSKLEEIIPKYEIDNKQGSKMTVLSSQLIHIRDLSMPVTKNNDELFNGQSRLYPLKWAVWNIHAAMEARNVMMVRRGAIGILSNEGKDVAGLLPIEQNEKDTIQTQFQKYGLASTQSQVIITNASLKWQSMTFPTKDLMLFEETEDAIIQIADAFDVPPDLLGATGSKKTYQNVLEAKKSLYQDAVIPESKAFAEAFTNWLLKGTNLHFDIYFDHLEIFQKSKKEEADGIKSITDSITVLYEKKLITLEEARMFLEQFTTEYGFSAETPLGSTYAVSETTPKTFSLTTPQS